MDRPIMECDEAERSAARLSKEQDVIRLSTECGKADSGTGCDCVKHRVW